MLFNSYSFLAFYAAVFVVYWTLGSRRHAQNLLLLLASYVFYAAWDYRFLTLILASTTVDYFAGRCIERADNDRVARRWLIASLVVNLGMLMIFKYLNFAVESFCELTAALGLPMSVEFGKIILPVGISFYTFQTLSYTIDVYRRRVSACRDPLAFAVYVAFFPQLVAGPIERATHFLPQVQRPRRVCRSDFAVGMQFVLLGYFYKVVLADSVAPIVDQFFVAPSRYGGSVAWLALIGFAVQIYGDFAGYSLIARGISRWLGFRLVSNFRQPYLATSPRDFWTRWHRSLSMWLRRYLYFELGGSRGSMAMTCRNLMFTMLLGGLWHGAAWNFVLWGGYHGLLLVIQHQWMMASSWSTGGLRPWRSFLLVPVMARRWLQVAAMFVLTLFGWMLFRCESLQQIQSTWERLFGGPWYDARMTAIAVPIFAAASVMLAMDLWRERQRSELVLLRAPDFVRWALYAFMVMSIIATGFRPTSFVYFQF